jgi:glycosyltransferase involved in cell wall biosynthesis
MKILMVNKFLYPNGGSETYMFELGKELERCGNEVQYFGMEHEGRIVSNHAEQYTTDMEFHGSGLAKLTYPFKIIYSKEARKKMRIVLEDFKPDVVHLNNINFQLTPSVIDAVREYDKAHNTHTKLIATAHDYQWVCPNHMMLRKDEAGNHHVCFKCEGGHYENCTKNRCIHGSRLQSVLGTYEARYYAKCGIYKQIDRVIAPSNFLKDKLETNSQFASKIVMMHNFIPQYDIANGGNNRSTNGRITYSESYAEDPKLILPMNYVLYSGRFAEEKGIKTLLEVCRQLPNIQFVFAGNGSLQNEVDQVENITCIGFLDWKTMQQVIRNAEFAVFPSEWYENCPFTVMEAQLNHTPLIASDMGGTPELMEDGVRGELYHGGDAAQLKEKIEKFYNNPELVQKYRNACDKLPFDTVSEYYDKYMSLVAEFSLLRERF